MREAPTVLHLDMDAFYASVEQLHKPSLRGRPVVVGGTGLRGVVATASYEARQYGVRSAMSTGEARRRCPQAVFLAPRFAVYGALSAQVMELLRELSPAVEPLSLDEAFIDLEAGFVGGLDTESVTALASRLKARIHGATGLTASVGAATSKLLAKIASDAEKPDGLVVVPPGRERALLDPLPVRALWGVGPATAAQLQRAGITTVGELAARPRDQLVGMLGSARGGSLFDLARGVDPRPVVSDRELKSVSVEDTFPADILDATEMVRELDALSGRVAARLRARGRSGRTITIKVRRGDFTTVGRSETQLAPTDDAAVIRSVARRLLESVETGGGVRLLGVGVSGLADAAQGDLFTDPPVPDPVDGGDGRAPGPPDLAPGADVVHTTWGPGWVERVDGDAVTVRFETQTSGPGRARTLSRGDPQLRVAGE
ncbi:MAG TPA: DNA polymerase IV [Candidatus Binatia bacterium]|nr:DNA polymerase IV [Candidatus Binatia bacterium]